VLRLADFSGNQDANFGRAMMAWEASIAKLTGGKITFEASGGVRTNDVSELEPIAAAQRAAAVAALAASAPPAVTDPQGVIDADLARLV
jgi:hypothetical protein